MYPIVKRMLDILGAASLLVLTAPIQVLMAILVRLRMGSPILFRQRRPGRQELPFTCLKFRTMLHATDQDGTLLPDEQRLTRLGLFMRRTSLDELPQLWNIFRGDLSFVGPRPLLTQYLPYYTPEEHRRNLVRPGLTGWAQIHGRNYLDFDDRLRLDVWYVDHLSWKFDLSILLKTIWTVLSQRGFADNPEEPVVALDVQRSKALASQVR